MVPSIILLCSLLFLSLFSVALAGYGRSPKMMGGELISPSTAVEAGSDFLEANFTMPDGVPEVPRGKSYLFRVNCWGLHMRTPTQAHVSDGSTWKIYRVYFDVVGSNGPTKCEAHLEYQNVIYYRIYGEPRLGLKKYTGFVGPDILPRPAKTIFAKYLEFDSYNVTAGATQTVKIGMMHQT
eukprot:Platyproteum_vivax@DN7610_c2_g3_i1.p1